MKRQINYTINRRTLRLEPVNPRLQGNLWLVLTKMPDQKRGEYAEEFDVNAATKTIARRIVEQEIAKDYEAGLRPVRFIWQGSSR